MTILDTPAASTMTSQLIELAADHGLSLQPESLRLNEAGLDYRVAFARARDGQEWVLRVPRRPDVSAKLAEEQRILEFVAPRVPVAVPEWRVCSERLIAYPRLPGEPGLTLDANGQPVWHFHPASPEFATALGRLIAVLHALDREAAGAAGVPVLSADQIRKQWVAHFEAVRAEFEIAETLSARWQAWFENDALWPELTVFTHGELYSAHVLIDTPQHIVGVLDWTTAKVGDPAIDFVYQHMMGSPAFDVTVQAYQGAGGVVHPNLAQRCAEIASAGPIQYGLYALQTQEPQHRASAAAQLNPAQAG